MNADYWPEGAPRDAAYQMFTLPCDEERAARRFVARYGQGPPEFVFECPDARGVLRAGPVREERDEIR